MYRIETERGDAFYDCCASPQNSIVFKDFELSDLIREQERIRFRIESGEFLRCFVSHANSEVIKMCFLMHHLGGDGKSLDMALLRICEYPDIQGLTAKKPNKTYLTTPNGSLYYGI